MPVCDRCGNDYDKAFTVEIGGERHTFDRFECAIAALAPRCKHCDTRIIGHGLERNGAFYCCDHCAGHEA
jgi:hypothetical protein